MKRYFSAAFAAAALIVITGCDGREEPPTQVSTSDPSAGITSNYTSQSLQADIATTSAEAVTASVSAESAVSLYCHNSTQSIFHHCNGTEAHKSVESQTGDVQNFIPAKNNILVVLAGLFIGVGVIGVDQVAAFRITVDLDIFGKQGIETEDAVFAVPDNLCIGVAP